MSIPQVFGLEASFPKASLSRTGLLLIGVMALALFHPMGVVAQERDYQEWLQKQQGEYRQFLSEQDEAFLTFLKKEWTSASVGAAAEAPIGDKPKRTPRVNLPAPSGPSDESPVPTRDSAREQPSSPSLQQPESDSLSQARSKQFQGDMEGATDMKESSGPKETSSDVEEAMSRLESATDEVAQTPEPSPQPEPEETSAPEQMPSGGEDSGSDALPEGPTSYGGVTSEEESTSEESSSSSSTTGSTTGGGPETSSMSRGVSLSREASLSFFGVPTTVPYGPALAARLDGKPGKSSIRRFWKQMAKGPYRPTLDVLRKQRGDMNLSDWGYYLYLRKLARQLYSTEATSEKALWTWFMMMKSGYAARVGYHEGEVFLMLPIDQKVFGWPQMHIGGQRYYLMVEEAGGSLRTYEGQHGKASQSLQLKEGALPNMPEEKATRTVEFSFQGERHSLDIAHNPSAAEYLRAYPKVDLNVLFSAGVSPEAQASLEESLRPLIQGRSPRESLNLLLTFAQSVTDYKRDQDHFGEERFLFPEESLASDYSDCEDRAVLMAQLTRELLGRKVVGLKWPRHVALAVRAGDGLSAAEDDRTITSGGETYIYADPTYVGSDLGMEMPLIEDKEPEIITPVR